MYTVMQGEHHINYCHTKLVYENVIQKVFRKFKVEMIDNFFISLMQSVSFIKSSTYVPGFVHQKLLHRK